MRNAPVIFALIVALIFGVPTAKAEDWHDPSPHQIRFVTVQPDVKIETLDWGGTGRPLILIAGAGGTAHGFDDFALLLKPHFSCVWRDSPRLRRFIQAARGLRRRSVG